VKEYVREWIGADGTVYRVVQPIQVRPDQPRWWVDNLPPEEDVMLGPATPSRLHLLPAMCEVTYALVLKEAR
jgi:hypothetical protein